MTRITVSCSTCGRVRWVEGSELKPGSSIEMTCACGARYVVARSTAGAITIKAGPLVAEGPPDVPVPEEPPAPTQKLASEALDQADAMPQQPKGKPRAKPKKRRKKTGRRSGTGK